MNPIFAIISALLPIVTTELQQFKVISPTTGALITGIEGAAAAFDTTLTSAVGSSTVTATSLLAAISAAVTVLQTQTGISPTALVLVAALDKAITAGLAATAITSVDPSQLQPIAPLA
jgi:hypothetical protein